MPAGDSQRVWFPEMVARLEREWGEAMSFAALIGLRDGLDSMLQLIRSERYISSPLFICPKCGRRSSMAVPRVSVRAMILAPGAGSASRHQQRSKRSSESGPNIGTSTLSIFTARGSLNPKTPNTVASIILPSRIECGKAASKVLDHEEI